MITPQVYLGEDAAEAWCIAANNARSAERELDYEVL